MKSIIFLLLLLSSSLLARELRFSKDIPSDYVDLLKNDLQQLSSLLSEKSEGDQSLKSIMGLEQLSPSELTSWLTQRIGYIVGEDFDPSRDFSALGAHQYPNPSTFPSFDQEDDVPLSSSGELIIVMANLGAAQYLIGKSQRQLYGLNFDDGFEQNIVPLTSARIGLVKIGAGLFHQKLNFDRNDLSAEVNSIMRLATLFHEARHSDGNGETLGFFHTVCPRGHKYQGRSACDKNLNGPYMLDALLIEKMMKSCKSCGEEEKQFLRAHAEDSRSRVLSHYSVVDYTPEVKKQLEYLENSKQMYMAQWNNPNLSARQEMMITNALESIDNKIARLLSSGAKVEENFATTLWDDQAE